MTHNKKNFISLSKYPGTTGKTYYNMFFKKFNLDYTYVPYGTDDLKKSIDHALMQNVNGMSISMPYKKEIIQYLDEIDSAVTEYESCNTVLLQGNRLFGYNTDIEGVMASVKELNPSDKIIILGNGSIGKMFYRYLKFLNFTDILLVSRSLNNYHERHSSCDVLINCTALGTVNNNSPITELDKNIRLIIDLAINPGQLSQQAKARNINYFSGLDFYKHQFIKQFFIYTGLNIDSQEFKHK